MSIRRHAVAHGPRHDRDSRRNGVLRELGTEAIRALAIGGARRSAAGRDFVGQVSGRPGVTPAYVGRARTPVVRAPASSPAATHLSARRKIVPGTRAQGQQHQDDQNRLHRTYRSHALAEVNWSRGLPCPAEPLPGEPCERPEPCKLTQPIDAGVIFALRRKELGLAASQHSADDVVADSHGDPGERADREHSDHCSESAPFDSAGKLASHDGKPNDESHDHRESSHDLRIRPRRQAEQRGCHGVA